jgi:coenzyme PQQ precursor peptide PqqA
MDRMPDSDASATGPSGVQAWGRYPTCGGKVCILPLAERSCFALFLIIPSRPPSIRMRLGTKQWLLKQLTEETIMAWTTPTLVEICIGLEINGYLPAEF